jgi:hypothetical protein
MSSITLINNDHPNILYIFQQLYVIVTADALTEMGDNRNNISKVVY